MRTKTLILSAVAGLIGCASAMAQSNVFSLNAVGYINVTCPPGFTMIANQLNNITHGVADNSLKTLIPNVQSGTDGDGNPLGTMDGITVFKYNGSYVNEVGDDTSPGGWSGGGLLTFNPGEAGWIKNNRATQPRVDLHRRSCSKAPRPIFSLAAAVPLPSPCWLAQSFRKLAVWILSWVWITLLSSIADGDGNPIGALWMAISCSSGRLVLVAVIPRPRLTRPPLVVGLLPNPC